MFDDDDDGTKWGSLLPTRTGGAIGGARERQMAAKLQNFDAPRTVVRNNPDGSQTILKTGGGMARYMTTGGNAGQIFTELDYALRQWATPSSAGKGYYILGVKYAARITLTTYPSYAMFADYPTSTAVSDGNWTSTEAYSVENLIRGDDLVSKIIKLGDPVVRQVSVGNVTSRFDGRTMWFNETSCWTVVRLNRAKQAVINGKDTLVLKAPPLIDTNAGGLEVKSSSTGVSPLDQVTLFGRPWHGRHTSNGLVTEVGPTNATITRTPTNYRGDTHLVCFSGAVTEVAEATPQELAMGMSWRNYSILIGSSKKLQGGTLDSKTIGYNAWLYRSSTGKIWLLQFVDVPSSDSIPLHTTNPPNSPYMATISVWAVEFLSTYTAVEIGSIQVGLKYQGQGKGGVIGVENEIGAGAGNIHICNQSPTGHRGALTIRKTSVGKIMAVSIIEAVLVDSGDDLPGVALTEVSGWESQYSSEDYTSPPVNSTVYVGYLDNPGGDFSAPAPYEDKVWIFAQGPTPVGKAVLCSVDLLTGTTTIMSDERWPIVGAYSAAGDFVLISCREYSERIGVYAGSISGRTENVPYPYTQSVLQGSVGSGSISASVTKFIDIELNGVGERVYDFSSSGTTPITYYAGGSVNGSSVGTSSETGGSTVILETNCVVAAASAERVLKAVSPYGVYDFDLETTGFGKYSVCVNPATGEFQLNPNAGYLGFA